MTIQQILMLGQSGEIDSLRGWIMIGLAVMLGFTLRAFLADRKRKREVRREMAARFTISTRVMQEQPGTWREQGAGAKNERGAW